jgi:vitamin B12 transporter
MCRNKEHITWLLQWFSLCIALLLATHVYAQQDTIPLLPIEITVPRENENRSGSAADTMMMRFMPGINIEGVLEKFSPVFLKRSGAGGSIMPSYQGFSPAQVPVLWNGFLSNSGMTGVSDLSLYALSGNHGLSWGNSTLESQGITDALSMEQGWAKDSFRLNAGITAGSFGLISGSTNLQKLFTRAGVQGGATFSRAKNNYPYRNYTQIPAPDKRQDFAAYEKVVVSQGWRMVSKKIQHHLSGAVEGYYNNRQIPPSLLSPGNRATQKDAGLRGMLRWQYLADRWEHELRAGYFYSRLWYDDLSLIQTSDNTAHQLWLKEKVNISWNNRFRTEAGTDIGFGQVKSNNYAEKPSEWQANPYLAQSIALRNWLNVSGKVKAYLVQDFAPAITAQLSVYGKMTRNFPLYYFAEGKRTTRYPTLNDRFWQPGGNPDIEQENAWVVQGGLRIADHAPVSGWHYNLFVKAFHIRANDLIFWFPGNKIYWTPQNLQKVFSGGTELSGSVSMKKSDWTFATGATWQMTAITNQRALSTGDNSVGKQLLYMPRHMLKWYGLLAWKGWSLLPDLQCYDKRYITSENTSYLPVYAIFNMQAGHSHTIKNNHDLKYLLSIGNLFNQYYEEVAYKPMPGIHISGSIIYQFHP